MFNQLNIFEFAVIYLALGAPLGVYHLATHWGGSLVTTFSFAAVNVCVWPAAALVYAYGQLKGHDGRIDNNAAQATRKRLVLHAENILTTDELFTFREEIARYVGICDALNTPIGTSATGEILAILSPNEARAAKACSIRRNRTKLLLHQADARTGFLAQISGVSSREPLLLELASMMAVSLGDHIAADELKARVNSKSGNIHISSDRISMAA